MTKISIAAAVACGVLVWGCDSASVMEPTSDVGQSPALGLAAAVTENTMTPNDWLLFVPCAADGEGEWVELSGYVHTVVSSVQTENRIMWRVQLQPVNVSGAGLTTGDRYRLTGSNHSISTATIEEAQSSFTGIANFRIIGQGSGNNSTLHQNFLLKVNANGDQTVEFDHLRVDCFELPPPPTIGLHPSLP